MAGPGGPPPRRPRERSYGARADEAGYPLGTRGAQDLRRLQAPRAGSERVSRFGGYPERMRAGLREDAGLEGADFRRSKNRQAASSRAEVSEAHRKILGRSGRRRVRRSLT